MPPGSMTSTHTGNPICVAAACANIDLIRREGLVEQALAVQTEAGLVVVTGCAHPGVVAMVRRCLS